MQQTKEENTMTVDTAIEMLQAAKAANKPAFLLVVFQEDLEDKDGEIISTSVNCKRSQVLQRLRILAELYPREFRAVAMHDIVNHPSDKNSHVNS